jgi:hypothetical protein
MFTINQPRVPRTQPWTHVRKHVKRQQTHLIVVRVGLLVLLHVLRRAVIRPALPLRAAVLSAQLAQGRLFEAQVPHQHQGAQPVTGEQRITSIQVGYKK